MAANREERMQQRMRGAGRHEVGDDSFGFVLPGVEADASPEIPPPATAIRTEPNISAKRRRLSPGEAPAGPEQASSVARASARLGALNIQSSPAHSPPQPEPQPEPQSEPKSQPPEHPSSESSQARSSALRSSARLNPPKPDPYAIYSESPSIADGPEDPPVPPSVGEPAAHAEDDELESLPAAMPVPGSHSSIMSRRSGGLGAVEEEVTESPAEAPGSGHRRRIRVSNAAATQSARLQRAVMEAESGMIAEPTTSSPLARKTRMAAAASRAQPTRTTHARSRMASGPVHQAAHSSSPAARPPRKSDSTVASGGSARSIRSQGRRSTLSTVLDELDEIDELSSPMTASTSSARKPQPKIKPKAQKEPSLEPPKDHGSVEEQHSGEDDERAEEIDNREAARRIGRKRPRPSSPHEGSPELNAKIPDKDAPATKKRQKRPQESPAKQAQPKAQKPKRRRSTVGRSDGGEAIQIIVQRYTKRAHQNEDDTDADILGTEIPFANRGGVNVIDVLAQMCEEVIDSNLETLHKATAQAADSATKKEYRTKLRALEAFQEELRTRLLEHTIALDTMHALRKRVRSVHKEKLALRSEILRIRAEREQVALKMDAVRTKHERESRDSLHLLGLSSAMHDVELAVDNGRSAPDLGPKEKKLVELANLELLISRVSDEASVDGDGGGCLQQIKDFNSLLERAAAALEGK